MVLEFTQLIRVRAQMKSWSLTEIQEEKAQALRRPFRTWNAHCSVGRYNRIFVWEVWSSAVLRFIQSLPNQTPETGRSMG